MDEKIVGRWAGRSPSGDVVRFDFCADQSVVWTVGFAESLRDIKAKYSVNVSAEPLEIDIFDFDLPQLEGFRFLGIYQHEADGTLRLYGEPRRPDDSEPRPTHFSGDTIVLNLHAEGDRPTG